ncbi:MAG: restriction endonuclease subunit S [Gemmatimonadota bacterium]
MKGWRQEPFDAVIVDESGGNRKTPQREFLTAGRYPIVDQGKELIAGYTDDESRLCRATLPVIVFGDHTRCFKYVDFPFCIGADGCKVLRPRFEVDVKYLYHYLRQLRLTEGGYDRHFKYLKRSTIALPPRAEQRRIADIFDKADTLRAKRRSALAQLDTLTQSIFLDMFGDPVSNPCQWPRISFRDVLANPLRNGVSPSKSGTIKAQLLTLSSVTGDHFDSGAVKTGTFESTPSSNQTVSPEDFLICRGNGNLSLVARGFFPTKKMSATIFPDTIIAARVDQRRIAPKFLECVWRSSAVRRQIESLARTTNGTFKVNQTMLEGIELIRPPFELQDAFQRTVRTTDRLRARHAHALYMMDALFASLQHRAFRGEL